MVNDNHELLLELWARIKSHIQPKERLEVADILVIVFDSFVTAKVFVKLVVSFAT